MREWLLRELRRYWIENNVPNISDTNASFLKDIICISKAQNILEIWTANWFSTIHLWMQAEIQNAHVVSIDFSPHSFELAKSNIKKAKLEDTVSLLFWNALAVIPTMDTLFDFVFIDGMMKSTVQFIQTVWNKVNDWWVIIIDDVIKFRHKMTGLDDFLEFHKISYNILPIDEDDWIMMIIKQNISL